MAQTKQSINAPYAVLHAGFQKAASEHIQDHLQRAAKPLRSEGVRYVHLRDLRKKIGDRKNRSEEDVAAGFFANVARKAPNRLILSDENLLGPFNHSVRTGRLYQQQSPFIRLFVSQAPFPIREVHVAVQSYAHFFTATYVQYIKSLRAHHTDFLTARGSCLRVFDQLMGWHGMVQIINKRFPQARIHMWRHEDALASAELTTKVVGGLLGRDVAEVPVAAKRPTVSGRAIAELELIAQTKGIAALVDARKDVFAKYPCNRGRPAFDPFLKWEHDHLENLLNTDIKHLCRHPEVTFI